MDNLANRILIVDDDEDDALFINEILSQPSSGLPPLITHVESPTLALECLSNNTFDICLFDYRLGEMNGIELIRMVRDIGLDFPIILLTGQGDEEIAVEAIKSGATDYLVKSKLTSSSLDKAIRYATQLFKEEELRKSTEIKLLKSCDELSATNQELKVSMQRLQTAQNQILRADKLASIGRLATGVCHEILNPINIIAGHAQALKMERPKDLPLLQDLDSIMDEVGRVEKILTGLLKFSREEPIEIKEVDLIDNLNSVLVIMEKEFLHNNIKVDKHFEIDLPKIEVDADRIRQVFLNIINNARYAMNDGGTLTISALIVYKDILIKTDFSDQAQTGNESAQKKFLRISFTDTGPGIKNDDIGKLFDPFFTTKPEDKGTGLGLSVCYTIIQKHGGVIEVESELGKGASFIIDLPFFDDSIPEYLSPG